MSPAPLDAHAVGDVVSMMADIAPATRVVPGQAKWIRSIEWIVTSEAIRLAGLRNLWIDRQELGR